MDRRKWLQSLFAAAAGSTVTGRAGAAPAAPSKDIEALQKNWRMLLAEGVRVPSATDKVKLSNDDWRKRLEKTSYNVLREEGTERAGTSPLNNEHRAGVFACAGCDLPLFTSEMKFESGT
ncbi:MAG: peptide-methionine (R)-S-oxide reductase, partial [Burkholderiales bacterium]